MRVKCPHGRAKLAVEIYDGLCDIPDICKYAQCEFFDDSREATRRFHKALRYYSTLGGLLEREDNPSIELERRAPKAYEHAVQTTSDTQSIQSANGHYLN